MAGHVGEVKHDGEQHHNASSLSVVKIFVAREPRRR